MSQSALKPHAIDLRDADYWRRYVPFWHPDSPAPFKETAFHQFAVRTETAEMSVKSMLSSYELALLFALAKDYWTGAGEIVDLGCLYGLTTRCFAEGVRLNERVPATEKTKRVYAYDLFLAQDYEWWTDKTPTLHAGSWFPEFLDLNRDRLDYIVPCPGDLTKLNWGADRPIEILMVDAAKSWELNGWVVSRMFPRLIPGRSVVVQQDYMHFAEYWIAITMEYFRDYFEPLDFIFGASGVFLATRSLSPEDATIDLAAFTPDHKKALMDRAIARASRTGAQVLKTAKAKLLVDLGEIDAAEQIIESVDGTEDETAGHGDFSGIAASCANSLRTVIAQLRHPAGA